VITSSAIKPDPNSAFRGIALASSNNRTHSARFWIRVATFLIPMMFLGVVVFQPWVDPKWMFLDPLTSAQLSGDCCHTYYGFVSTLGVMMWTLTAAICLFTAFVLFASRKHRDIMGFAVAAGLLTGWLALDDAFMVHEVVFPSFGIPQNMVLVAYVVLGGLYLVGSWRVVRSFDFLILLAAVGGLGASLAIDALLHSLNPAVVLAEDSAKFLGIFCWMSFHVTSFASALGSLNAPNSVLAQVD